MTEMLTVAIVSIVSQEIKWHECKFDGVINSHAMFRHLQIFENINLVIIPGKLTVVNWCV